MKANMEATNRVIRDLVFSDNCYSEPSKALCFQIKLMTKGLY